MSARTQTLTIIDAEQDHLTVVADSATSSYELTLEVGGSTVALDKDDVVVLVQWLQERRPNEPRPIPDPEPAE